MATILHLQATVQPDGKIEITAPELQPGQQVNITIETENSEQLDAPRHVLDIVQGLPGHRLFKTAEEVDAYIREERDSWE